MIPATHFNKKNHTTGRSWSDLMKVSYPNKDAAPERTQHAMKKLIFIIFWIIVLSISQDGFAQVQDTTTYRVETKDGNEYIGKIVFDDREKIKLITKNLGEIFLNKNDIVKIEAIQLSQIKDGVLWFNNPQASRYFWMPNGYGIKKGEGYYQNVWIFVNQFTVAPSDHFSVGLGIVPLFLFGGTSTPLWVTGKFSIPVTPEKFNLGVGILSGTVIGEEGTGFGLAYGLTTFGSRDQNLSIGLGYGYSGGEWANTPTISVSGMVRTSNRGYFLTENYYIDTGEESLILISLGGRRIVKKTGIDFGLFIPFKSGMETFVAIPWLGITVPLGTRKK
jgi:hypothetical protein